LLTCGCVSLVPPNAAPSDACRRLDESHIAWYAVGIASGSLAGATGTSGVLTSTLADEPYADLGLAVSSTIFGALATLGTVLAGIYAERYVECLDEPVVEPPESAPSVNTSNLVDYPAGGSDVDTP